ncbi:uncharacterized protein KY384_008366 [Bacidia gigantensis]|uniref:uncharacterized protein n=1 Tax=Bacidia gigantensis TaxID=2732470 RepID=UPI001D056790|nr:uncharacterized protein KY384_008366 [Bacidia gigantensis]KAG8526937.1 hypothetical protein KY384_008366 [Bacidia gigantensis]
MENQAPDTVPTPSQSEGHDTKEQVEGASDSHASPDLTVASKTAGAEASTDAASEAPQTNGDPALANSETQDATQESAEADEDTIMKDAGEATEASEAASKSIAPPTANGTPATNKRASIGGSSKKKSSAVPEHKSKKVNKKKSRPLTHLDANPGEYFFARMKGHPPWPSIICDEQMLPHSLLTTRPVTAALPDGTFKKADYADGGKRAYERTFPVMFLHTNEFAWIPNTELTPLDPDSDDVKSPNEKGKTKTLIAAYSKAAEASTLDAFKAMLTDHQKALEEDIALQEEREAKKAEKAKKTARKSSDAKADDDEMDVDDEVAEKPKSKKRKKAADESDADEKPAKTPKTTTKLKLSTPKQPVESATKKKASRSKAKANKSGSDEDAQTPKVEEKPLSPTEMKEIKEKKVLYFRHKLQRGFLSRDTVPKAEEMKSMSDFLSDLEALPDLEGSIIRTTKIHKVLKQMIKLENIPLEEEHKFKDRSAALLTIWNDTLSSDGPPDEKGEERSEQRDDAKSEQEKDEDPKEAKKNFKVQATAEEPNPTVNGESKETKEEMLPEVEPEKATSRVASEEKTAESTAATANGVKDADVPEPTETETEKTSEPTVQEVKGIEDPAVLSASSDVTYPAPAEAMDTSA